jgi:hypothetical protein
VILSTRRSTHFKESWNRQTLPGQNVVILLEKRCASNQFITFLIATPAFRFLRLRIRIDWVPEVRLVDIRYAMLRLLEPKFSAKTRCRSTQGNIQCLQYVHNPCDHILPAARVISDRSTRRFSTTMQCGELENNT